MISVSRQIVIFDHRKEDRKETVMPKYLFTCFFQGFVYISWSLSFELLNGHGPLDICRS